LRFADDEDVLERLWQEFIPTVSHLTKIGKMQLGGCQLCRRVREVCGESTDDLVVEIYVHINREGYQI